MKCLALTCFHVLSLCHLFRFEVNLVLMELGQEFIPVYKHYRLNERSYGNLVGLNKKETVKMYGKDQVKRWRRSYDEPPPPMTDDHPYHPARDPRYRLVSIFSQERKKSCLAGPHHLRSL